MNTSPRVLSQLFSLILVFFSSSSWALSGLNTNPAPGAELFVGANSVAHRVTAGIRMMETGDSVLDIKAGTTLFSGIDAGDFQLLTALPLSIPDNAPAQELVVQCTPQNTGMRTATLNLSTNAPNQANISYALSCQGLLDTARYQALPEEHRGIFITTPALGERGTAGIEFIEVGTQDLIIEADAILLNGSNANDFKLQTPLPLKIANGQAPQTLVIECTPSAEGLQQAMLHLRTNVPDAPLLTYPLACIGNAGFGDAFDSFPAPNATINFTETDIGVATRSWLSVLNAGSADSTTRGVAVTQVQLTDNAGDFSLQLLDSTATLVTLDEAQLRPASDFTLLPQSTPRQLAITCTPKSAGNRRATLSFNTSDADYPQLQYSLLCPAREANIAPTDILLSNTQLVEGDPAGTVVGVLSSVDENTTDVHTYAVMTGSASIFSVIGNQLMINDMAQFVANRPEYSVILNSTDSTGLSIEKAFIVSVSPNVIFNGEVRDAAGLLVNTVDNSESFSLTGIILPSPVHVGSNAIIEVMYAYTNPAGTRTNFAPIQMSSAVLNAEVRLDLFQGRLLYLPGQFEVTLSYTLDSGETRSGLAQVLNVNKNTIPQDIILSGQEVAENSPVNTLVGTLQTVDGDQGDSFTYALTHNPGVPLGYFQIVGNELRMANSFPLNFENTPDIGIIIRSVDANGGFITKNFTINVVDQIESRMMGELRSSGTLLPYSTEQMPTVRGDRQLTLDARIFPEPNYVGLQAEVYYEITFTSTGSDPVSNRIVLDSDVVLSELMDYQVFDRLQTPLSGTVQITVGYRLLDDSGFDFSDTVAAFVLEENTPLQESWPKLAQPLCQPEYVSPDILDLNAAPDNSIYNNDFLSQSNALIVLADAGLVLQQDDLNAVLFVDFNDQRLAWWPLLIQTTSDAPQGNVALGTRHTLKLWLDNQLLLIAEPAVQDICALQAALNEVIALDQLMLRDSGDVQAYTQDNRFLSLRPDLAAFIADAADQTPAGFYRVTPSRALLVYLEANQQLMQQGFYATPGWPGQLASHVDNLQFESPSLVYFQFNGSAYRGVPDMMVEQNLSGSSSVAFNIEDIGDMDNDGLDDFSVVYTNGDRQVFYTVAP